MEKITRREFIKDVTLGAAAVTAASCAPKSAETEAKSEIKGEMEMRTNPGNGDKVSLLGYGCMRWPMTKDEQGKDIIDQEKVNELVDKAIAHGVNLFDTSPAYLRGQSEKATGIALSRYPRNSYFLSTKLSNFGDASREASMKMYHDSFEQLQTDYLDYYLFHNIGRGGLDAFRARYVDNGMDQFLLKEREKGNIRQLGFSFHGKEDAFDDFLHLYDKYHWDFVLIQMNYVDWKHADGVKNSNAEKLYEELYKRNIPVFVMEPLRGGRLASLPEAVARQLKEREPSRSVSSWAFRFVGTQPGILSCLSGMTYMEHLEDNLSSFCDFKPLSADDLEFIEKMAKLLHDYPSINCNDCKYCMPCPYGVDIPGIFRNYNNSVNEGVIAQSREQEDYARLKRAYLLKYDRSIESLRQANHCIGCKRCIEHCPQSIDIPKELRKIDSYVERLKKDTL